MPEQIPFPVLHVHLGPSSSDDGPSLAELAGDLRRVDEVRQSAVVAEVAFGSRLENATPRGRTRRMATTGGGLSSPGPGLRALAAVSSALADLVEPLPPVPAGDAPVDASGDDRVEAGDGRRAAERDGGAGDTSAGRGEVGRPRLGAPTGGEGRGRAVQWPVPERWPVVHAHGARALRAVWIAAAWRGSSARIVAAPLPDGDDAPAGLWRRADLVAAPDRARRETLSRRGVERRRLRVLPRGDGEAALRLYRRLAAGERRRVQRVDRRGLRRLRRPHGEGSP